MKRGRISNQSPNPVAGMKKYSENMKLLSSKSPKPGAKNPNEHIVKSRDAKTSSSNFSDSITKVSKPSGNNNDIGLTKIETINTEGNQCSTANFKRATSGSMSKQDSSVNYDQGKVTNLSFINNDTEIKIIALRKELTQRGVTIFDSLVGMIEMSRFDPILDVFKSNPLTHQFFINRILELVVEALNNEREKTLETILLENKSLNKKLLEKDEAFVQTSKDFEDKMVFLQERIKELEKMGKEKDKLIESMEDTFHKNKEKTEETNSRLEQVLIENEKKGSYILSLEMEREGLKTKISQIDSLPKQAEQEINQLRQEINSKNQIITQMQSRLGEMKGAHDEILNKVNSFYEDNSNLKEEIEKKNYLIEELITKIEQLKLEFDNRVEEKKNEIEQLTKINNSLNDSINGNYKQKINALKAKLREKVNALSSLEKQYEDYRNENEAKFLKYVQNSQKIISEKNQIINDLIRGNKTD